ncbi:TetR/AcrR family transcriptional regulator [Staphylococcus sp. IVB6181]|uniref:TetR/AcrR family transcriptional regulator n=1 Tax=Staphylococcus sp. IVB6181 TaxID=2929481 RepID=UPI0021D148AB|nr:TetR/AcrR family transcriptional regulator [Staphylococcus sp. IVB6181]UXV35085.1 TetR/AcrR family transcriptional regulator [Staphylococcus sp. IVB6181]
MDARSMKTKKTIKETLLELLKHQSIEQLSVTDICDSCQIGRRTFYDHFSNKFEVIEQLIEDYITDFQAATSDYGKHSFKANIEIGFQFIYEHHEKFVLLYKSSISRLFLKRIETSLIQMMQSYLNHAYLQQQCISTSTILTFLSNAVLGIMIEIAMKKDVDYLNKTDEIVQIVRPYFKISQ